MRKKLLVVGLLVTILTGLVLALGVLILATQEGRTAPQAITGLIATDASYIRHGQIDLVWSPSDARDFAYYSVYASETEITDVTELFPIGQINDRADVIYQTTRYRVPELSLALFAFLEDTEYWFAITAVDLSGNESEVGTSVSATIEIMPQPPLVPTVFIRITPKDWDPEFVTENTIMFSPSTVTVDTGTTVAWTNIDEIWVGCYFERVPHTVTSDTGLFHSVLGESVLAKEDNIFYYTFTEAGVFDYHCELHSWETGKVIVEQAVEEPVDG